MKPSGKSVSGLPVVLLVQPEICMLIRNCKSPGVKSSQLPFSFNLKVNRECFAIETFSQKKVCGFYYFGISTMFCLVSRLEPARFHFKAHLAS